MSEQKNVGNFLVPVVSELLEYCQGKGKTIAIMPAALPGDQPPHHFYAGVIRPPALSFLEALLLNLGGDLPSGEKRYEEIVVLNAGNKFDEEGRDKPTEEGIRLREGSEYSQYGLSWQGWWYRKPEAARQPKSSTAPSLPSPTQGRRRDWSAIPTENSKESASSRAYPIAVDLTETEIDLPKRHKQIRQVIENLVSSSRRSLLLLELAVLDLPNPASIDTHKMGLISEEGRGWMRWLPEWIDTRDQSRTSLDVVLYSRNRRRVEAFITTGLPRMPSTFQGPWPSSVYLGRNLPVLEYPCGTNVYGEGLFAPKKYAAFSRADGTSSDTPEGRRSYADRSLRNLLRGDLGGDRRVRIRLGETKPVAPTRPRASGHRISREFWAVVDVESVQRFLNREFFGAQKCRAIVDLLETLRFMRTKARQIEDPDDFHQEVRDRWKKVSRLMLWGVGGMGKSHLGILLGRALYGHDSHLFKCQEVGGGSATDPTAGFRSRLLGSPVGYLGSDSLTDIGKHIVGTQGFTVLVFEEVQKIAPDDFGGGMEALYGILEDREYSPQNSRLTQDRRISLWNSVIVMTANLKSFPPPGVQSEKAEAIIRRVTDHEFQPLSQDQHGAFLQYHLVREAEKALDGVAVCSCSDLTPSLARLGFHANSLDMLRRNPRVMEISDRIRRDLEGHGISSATCPLVLDVTPFVARAIEP